MILDLSAGDAAEKSRSVDARFDCREPACDAHGHLRMSAIHPKDGRK